MNNNHNDNNVKILMKSILDYEMPETTVFFEDSEAQYTFSYDLVEIPPLSLFRKDNETA